jgi:ABC-type branched-subunit amino acid transport system ATPase component
VTDLEVTGLQVRFGGLLAVDDLSLVARAGEVTGLIGPNGAGKTTTFNAITGVVPATKGTVRLGGETLDGLSTAVRARRGLGRTFQRMELFDTMTALENVAMGPEVLFAGRSAWRHLVAVPRERAETMERAESAMARCGIGHLADTAAFELSTGQRRLVELARAMASPFRFLLLDEPSSGLDAQETARFAAVLRSIVEDDGTGILLVEHDMSLVRATCRSISVLDFGRLIFSGTTAEALASDLVKAAYLGSEAVEAVGG